ncbi:MAG: hypothetical protein IJL98_06950 [Lachnospiraceae bacterium]|nr:hypothetical protein [Lachnospiraceae bacterium]
MKVFRYMWTAASLDHKRKSVLKQLKSGSVTDTVWLVALPEQPTHMLDIYPSKIFRQTYFKNSDQWIIGVASEKAEAEELACSIVSLVFSKTGNTDVAAYLAPVLEEETEVPDD